MTLYRMSHRVLLLTDGRRVKIGVWSVNLHTGILSIQLSIHNIVQFQDESPWFSEEWDVASDILGVCPDNPVIGGFGSRSAPN